VAGVDATSGDASSRAGVAQTTADNTQLGTGTVNGGSGALTVSNSHSSTISDSSAAASQAGLSVALGPTGAATPPQGLTAANSGSSSATGISASNTVANTSMAAVQVDGISRAPVDVSSNADVVVKNQGASDAKSGPAWAVAAGAAGSPSGVSAPAAAGAPSSTSSLNTTALHADNSITSSTQTNVTSAGGRDNAAPISITPPPQFASADNRGTAIVTSGAACGAGTCAGTGAAAGPGVSETAQSASGAADARGLVARNEVTTDATVAVRVRGRNYAPIKVMIDSITQIFNLGVAQSTSGDSTAGGGAAAASTSVAPQAAASSGSAQASGAVVENRVNLRSSANVRVRGDNYSPIDVVLNLASNLVNWGVGLATSGDAQARDGSGAANGSDSATSGGASARGLQVFNVISMWADASVDVEGDNYAPIAVDVHFKSNVDNRGLAVAQSGNVAAGAVQTAAPTTGQTPASPSPVNAAGSASATSSGGSSSVANSATGGNAVATSNSATSTITSDQISSANGGKPITSTTITKLLRSLPSGSWTPVIDEKLPATVPADPQPGLNSRSGNATAVGLHSDMVQSNVQMVACADSGASCMAKNSATLNAALSDSPRNLASDSGGNGPGTVAVAQAALVNATPTPVPSLSNATSNNARPGTPSGNGGSGGSGVSGGGHKASVPPTVFHETIISDVVATGHVVLADPWDLWPGRRLPPMPDPDAQRTSRSTVDASLGGFPGMDELPLPDLGAASQPQTAAQRGPASALRLPGGTMPSGDVQAESGDEFLALLAVFDVDPWATWPGVDELPTPAQVVRRPAIAVAGEQVAGEQAAAASDDASPPPAAGTSPADFGLAGTLAAAAGAFAALWRWRGGQLMALATTVWRDVLLTARGWFSGLGRVSGRAHALLRMTLGVLRLW